MIIPRDNRSTTKHREKLASKIQLLEKENGDLDADIAVLKKKLKFLLKSPNQAEFSLGFRIIQSQKRGCNNIDGFDVVLLHPQCFQIFRPLTFTPFQNILPLVR